MRWGALAGLLVATASLAACSSDAPTSRSSGSVAVSLASPTLTVSPGGQVSTTVTITRTTSAAGSVTLGADNLPVGVTATFAPSTLVGDAATSELTFAVPSSTPPGTSAVTIRAVGADSSAATVQLELAISTPEPSGYTLDVTPSVIPVPQRASGSATIIIQRTGNFAGAVSLEASGFPAGITVMCDPPVVTGGASTLDISIDATVTTGNYIGILTGRASGLPDQILTFTINVTR